MESKIVVNARFLTQNTSGVQRFASEVALAMKEVIPNLLFVCPNDIVQRELANKLDARIVGRSRGHRWEQIDLPIYLYKNGNPQLLNLCNVAPICYNKNILTVHDLAIYDVPESYNWKFITAYKILYNLTIKRAESILTVSDFSKSRLKDRFGVDAHVIYNSISAEFKCIEREGSKEKFILAVSSIDPKKNFVGLLNAFSKLNLPDYKLLIVGGENSVFKSSSLFSSSDDKVKFLGRVSDKELINLYQRAAVFVFPSFYEGFGIPPLEAMACGCPTVVSDIPSLREICGNASIFVDPFSVESIASGINSVLVDQSLSKKLSNLGLKNIERYSWSDSAIKISRILAEINN